MWWPRRDVVCVYHVAAAVDLSGFLGPHTEHGPCPELPCPISSGCTDVFYDLFSHTKMGVCICVGGQASAVPRCIEACARLGAGPAPLSPCLSRSASPSSCAGARPPPPPPPSSPLQPRHSVGSTQNRIHPHSHQAPPRPAHTGTVRSHAVG